MSKSSKWSTISPPKIFSFTTISKHTGSKVQRFTAASTFGAVPAVVAMVEVAEAELRDKGEHDLLG